jgi:Tol biopolymer transport system component
MKGNRDVYVMDASGGNLRAVVSTDREEAAPFFQPDGMGLFYLVASDSIFEIRRLQRDPSLWGAPKFMRKSGLIIPSPDNSKWVFSANNREACPDCPLDLYVSSSDGSNLRRVQLKEMPKLVASFGNLMWSSDSRYLFVPVRETDGTSAIWQVSPDGDLERRLVRLPDPERQFYRTSFSVGPTHFYFPIGNRQSDIWTMELKQ